MKQKIDINKIIKRTRSPLRRGIIAVGVAMIVFPEPVTTAIGTAMVGACLAVPEPRGIALVHSGATIRRGRVAY